MIQINDIVNGSIFNYYGVGITNRMVGIDMVIDSNYVNKENELNYGSTWLQLG